MSPIVSIRRAALLVFAGLLVQLFAVVLFTPGTFVFAAAVGLPLVALGVILFLVAIWRVLRDRGAI
jgi:hypothetical protein